MQTDEIEAIGIDENDSLWVKPATGKLPYIYRAGASIHWDEKRGCLYCPKPREWSQLKWFTQLLAAAHGEYGIRLVIGANTKWSNIDSELKRSIQDASNSVE